MPGKLSSRKRKMFKANKDSSQEIAVNRIAELFSLAEGAFERDKSLSKRYLFLAGKIATKFKVSFNKEQKIRSCKMCGAFLVHGKNARIRLSKGNIVIRCDDCKNIRRLKYR